MNVTNLSGVPTWNIILAKYVLELTGKQNLLEIWPNLELYLHGAVSFKPYREQFKQLIPSQEMYYLETYNASEGFFGIQDQSNSEEMLLMLDYGVYYEFLPMERFNDDNPTTLNLSEVELHKNYAIEITGRTKHYINAFGEELIVDNAEKALTIACQQTNAIIREYTACPIYFKDNHNSGGHEWIIEFEQSPNDMQLFTKILDQTLREVNSDYDAKRFNDLAMKIPRIHIAPEGVFFSWMKKRGKLGGQHKVPRLMNDRSYVDDILKMMQTVAVNA